MFSTLNINLDVVESLPETEQSLLSNLSQELNLEEINPNDSASNLKNMTSRNMSPSSLLAYTSALKTFFDKPSSNFDYKTQKLHCKICLKLVKGNKTTNSNLIKHAKSYHTDLWEAAVNGQPIPATGQLQISLEDSFRNANMKIPYSHESFLQSLVEWIVADEQSFLV